MRNPKFCVSGKRPMASGPDILTIWVHLSVLTCMRCLEQLCLNNLTPYKRICSEHYSGVIMSAMASEITSVLIVCSTVCSGADQRKHQSSASLAFVRGIHQRPVDSPHKGASKAENVTIWWRHHEKSVTDCPDFILFILSLNVGCHDKTAHKITQSFHLIFLSILRNKIRHANSMWQSDVIWPWRFWSTLIQCLTTISH